MLNIRFAPSCALLALTFLPLGVACEREHDAEQHVHGQDERGFVFVDPQQEAHPNWLDFGEIEIGDSRTERVRLRNVESKPIVVETMQTGCSCTVPTLYYVDSSGAKVTGDVRSNTRVIEVPPQAVLEIDMRVDSRLSPVINKEKLVIVRMTTDSDADPYVTIEARMKIVSAFQAVPPLLELQRIGVNSGGEAAIEIAPIGDVGRMLVEVLETPPGVVATLTPSSRQGSATWELRARVDPPLAPGAQEHTLKLRTTGSGGVGEGRPYEVKMRWTGTPDVEVVPSRLLFLRDGATGRDRAQTELFSRMPGNVLKIVGHTLTGENTGLVDVTVEAAQPDPDGKSNRWRITLEPKDELGDKPVQGVLLIETDDPQFPRFEVPIVRRGT
ncbi:MAG: DUF1573 domain-containing protein [Planctomycetes bacterium]|nr:DUF1573 domain-containing protein [Planctomycetota bacterium]